MANTRNEIPYGTDGYVAGRTTRNSLMEGWRMTLQSDPDRWEVAISGLKRVGFSVELFLELVMLKDASFIDANLLAALSEITGLSPVIIFEGKDHLMDTY